MPTTNTTALEALPFSIDSGSPRILTWKTQGCRPATSEEALMWDALESSAPSAAEPVAIPDLTPEQLADKCEAWLSTGTLTTNVVDAYEAGYRDCEAAHAVAFSRQATQSAAEPVASRESALVQEINYARVFGWPKESMDRLEAMVDANAPAPSPASEREALTDERAAFEAWIQEANPGNPGRELVSKEENCPTTYCYNGVRHQWRAWQARAALHSTGKPDGEVAK